MTALSTSPDKALPPRRHDRPVRPVIVGGLIYFPLLILGPIGERITG
jgi:hypothetical protein